MARHPVIGIRHEVIKGILQKSPTGLTVDEIVEAAKEVRGCFTSRTKRYKVKVKDALKTLEYWGQVVRDIEGKWHLFPQGEAPKLTASLEAYVPAIGEGILIQINIPPSLASQVVKANRCLISLEFKQ